MQSLKISPAIFCVFLLQMLSTGFAFSQSDTISFNGFIYARVGASGISALKDAKDSFFNNSASEAGIKETSVHIKAIRHFNKWHEKVPDEIWRRSSNGFSASFYEGPVFTTVRYNNAGRFIHSMKRYSELSMPKEIRAQVKPVYYDYSIVVVYELMDASYTTPAFFIHLKDDTRYKIVRVYLDEMLEIQSFRHQKLKK